MQRHVYIVGWGHKSNPRQNNSASAELLCLYVECVKHGGGSCMIRSFASIAVYKMESLRLM